MFVNLHTKLGPECLLIWFVIVILFLLHAQENGYQLLFLSARAISQAHITRRFLFSLKQVLFSSSQSYFQNLFVVAMNLVYADYATKSQV